MFNKVLVANRGEIAVRIIRTCRAMGIPVLALYDPEADLGSLHVRLADECVPLPSELGYLDQQGILQIARQHGCDAIHPGYGFLAEQPSFARACEQAQIVFVGPPADLIAALHDKVALLDRARAAGFATPSYARLPADAEHADTLQMLAEQLGFPLIVKPSSGGLGAGARLVSSPERLADALWQTRAEAQLIFGNSGVYVEKPILPASYVEVQLLGDRQGNLVHLGERQALIQRHSQRVIVETPAPSLSQSQREALWAGAVQLASLFGCTSACTVEFLIDGSGRAYVSDIKPRIQVEHPVSEALAAVDMVREQLRIAAGAPLRWRQSELPLQGWAMLCRISAEDPWSDFLPRAGRLSQLRLPGGPQVRVDTFAYSGCLIPPRYDPTLAKVITWGEDRQICLERMRCALDDFLITGVPTDLPLLRRLLDEPEFVRSGTLV